MHVGCIATSGETSSRTLGTFASRTRVTTSGISVRSQTRVVFFSNERGYSRMASEEAHFFLDASRESESLGQGQGQHILHLHRLTLEYTAALHVCHMMLYTSGTSNRHDTVVARALTQQAAAQREHTRTPRSCGHCAFNRGLSCLAIVRPTNLRKNSSTTTPDCWSAAGTLHCLGHHATLQALHVPL